MENKLKSGDVLEDVLDIFGNHHDRVSVIRDLENTVTGQDLDTLERRVFHKSDLGLDPRGKYGYDRDVTVRSFDLEESHSMKLDEKDLMNRGAWQPMRSSQR